MNIDDGYVNSVAQWNFAVTAQSKHSIRRDLRKMLVECLIGLFLDNRIELIDHHACRKILQLRVTAWPWQFQQIAKKGLMRIDPSFHSVPSE